MNGTRNTQHAVIPTKTFLKEHNSTVLMDTLIIGCGNLLRGDDAVGPILVRVLAEQGTPPGVRLADGGTAGMDVAFKMRGADHVIIVDACQTGQPPGTLYQVPGEELAHLPPLTGLNLHSFRWDHALAFGRWLLKEEYPDKITVYLIEARSLELGGDLTPPVRATMQNLVHKLLAELELIADGAN